MIDGEGLWCKKKTPPPPERDGKNNKRLYMSHTHDYAMLIAKPLLGLDFLFEGNGKNANPFI
jgi:hypothetical protein